MDGSVGVFGEIKVTSYTDVVGPRVPMLGPLQGGGILVANTVHGCWGPMITPEMRSGHEVTQPVAVAGAAVGDSVVLEVKRVAIRSRAAASGTDSAVAGRFNGDPFVSAVCPQCGKVNPPSDLQGIGAQAVRCRSCGAESIPFTVPNGYTMVFDDERSLGVTVGRAKAEEIARQAADYANLWVGAKQHPALILALGDLPGILTRVRPMIGNVGTTPAVTMPSSHNAGDFGQFLVGAPHDLALTQAQLSARTDAHMDVDSVGEGTVLVCPVKVPGAGVYVGDVHAMQGDGEVAGHTTDVAGEVVLRVTVIKDLALDGPVLLPRLEDLPPLAKPYTAAETAKGAEMADRLGVELETQMAPVQVVGSGRDLTDAVGNGITRLANLAGMDEEEVRNRITLTGAIEIGRLPGVVQVTALLPLSRLNQLGLGEIYRTQYGL